MPKAATLARKARKAARAGNAHKSQTLRAAARKLRSKSRKAADSARRTYRHKSEGSVWAEAIIPAVMLVLPTFFI